jgi:hypothetical protein
MKAVTTALGAAMMLAALAAPATAEYVRLGSVDVGYRVDSDTAYTRFGGRLESLRLIAGRSDIYCRSVIVRYEGGDVQNVFSGRLDERRPVDVDLRGRARRVDSISFVCRSDEYRGGKIFVEGEVGHFRDEWRRDRDWDRSWAGLFGALGDRDRMGGPDRMGDRDRMGGPDRMGDRDRMDDRDRMGWQGDRDRRGGPDRGGFGDRDWIVLGQQSFQGSNDKESTFTDWNGRHVDRIALRPIETDAQCMSIVATYDGGRKVKLADGRMLERGRVAVYDLPGDQHNLSKVFLRCRAVSGYRVTIEILARR